jgi:hypothetical protein
VELSDTILKWDYPRSIPAKFGLIWFSGFREEALNVIFYQNMLNLHNRHKSAERKILQKSPEYKDHSTKVWFKLTFKASSLKPLNQIKPNLAGIDLG